MTPQMNLDSNKIVAHYAQHKCRATKCGDYDGFLINESIDSRTITFGEEKLCNLT